MVSSEWGVVLGHVANISFLMSMLPVLGEIRLGSHRRSIAAPPGQKKDENEEPPPVALGPLSILLFTFAELSRCWKLFDPSAKHVEKIVKKVKEIVDKPGHPTSQFSGKLVPILNDCFADNDIRSNIHSLVTVVLLISILVSLILRNKKNVKDAVKVFVAMVVAGIFVWTQMDLTLKVWKAAIETGFVASLYFPLMALGVVFSKPVDTGFGCAQLVWWVARFSLVFQSTVPQLKSFVQDPNFLWTSPEMGVMLLNIVVMGWLLMCYLPHVESSFVILGLLLAMSFMPPLLTKVWEPGLGMIGWKIKTFGETCQLMHLSVIGMLFLVGGTVNVLCLTGLINILIRIHGQDALGIHLG